jgi:4-diphosphocytidyl-2C-methyl-D-erythritol kinase
MSGSGSACFGVFAPEADVSALERGWPAGTRTWRTHLLSRAAYRDATRCVAVP